MTAAEDAYTVEARIYVDSRLPYRKPGQRQSRRLRDAERSLEKALERFGAGAPTRLFLVFQVGPPEGVAVGTIEVGRYHARDQSIELTLEFDSTLPDDEVGAQYGRMVIEAIELGRQALAKRKANLNTDAVVARVEQWVAGREWLEWAPKPPTGDAWPERLEIHVEMTKEWGVPFASGAMGPIEWQMDRFLEGSGAYQANEIRANEWVTYVDCMDADAVLEKLTPRLNALRVPGSVYVLICTRVGESARVDIR